MYGPRLRNGQDFVIAEQVRTDRLQQLFRQSVSAVFGSYLAAIMLSWLCWDRFEHGAIFWWMAILTASTLLRIAMFVAYFRSDESQRTPRHWERKYWVTLVLSASIWGGGAFVLMPADDLLSQALVMLFTVGMSVSAVSCYSAYRDMTLVSIGVVLLPCTIWLLFQPSPIQLGMALSILVFAAFAARATHKMSQALEIAFRLTREMEQANSISTRAAQTDELTGLKSRRAFFEHAQQLYDECKAKRQGLCAVMLDMDHFKHINDTYGHQVGDQVLRQMGAVISSSFRVTDIHGRLGGEEFAILLPNTSIEVATQIAERLIDTIAGLMVEPVLCISASLGVASTEACNKDLHSLMNDADKALYRAKALGRNRVAVA
ncbi:MULTISPECIES: diguanylate cyclase [unclassified Pseudomonas]|uniref:GGDEF domain-containing protein n=1 Tax=unclassified Pseudomonas TaxID=196821 RepID=UPI000876611E|nr:MULTISPECIES: diguanylate cyclase [unclassified Pseudomonas]SCZ42354.1 diguanylate cyclase (GGDEF) domain-containing protein [Pseudomonas sp. NFACC44-2]SDA77968.1 diguanylate cyclase (GGDEF) domain-containing protein [Pseudomonas sp. NFACC51]SEK01259.1 diguanylate cyclase (GGDEF) domain-containing protein [Pseudomonas sp. NFACC07-1]SFI39869.1 diguanylate cyclase (GGDEF) domain-containing protein [Pseudomonas sp. NFACC54]SFT08473.1 diguanylate cyclase (GGDEF) domain-containing protein [Pseud